MSGGDESGIFLSDYIEQVCKEILTGVVKAQGDDSFGKYIGCTPVSGEYKDEAGNNISYVEFSVAAEVSSTASGQGGIKVPVFGGIEGKFDKAQSVLNRVEFSIPIVIPSPVQQVELREKIERDRDESRKPNQTITPPRVKKPMARGY